MPPLPSDSENRIEDVFLRDWCAPLNAADVEIRPRLVHEDDAAAILDTARQEAPDALVIGQEHHHTHPDFFTVSPLHRILHTMPRPVILVPGP